MDTANRGRPGLSLLLTSVAFFMVALDALVVVTALPAIHRSLGGSLATLEWAVNAYGLTFAAGMITAAALGDRLRPRPGHVGRAAPVQPGLGGVRARPDRGHADRRPGRPGARRGRRHAAQPDDPDQRVPRL